MKNENIKIISKYSVGNTTFKPVKNAISEELQEIVGKVYQLDSETGRTLQFLTNIMMTHFHEDVARVTYKELSPIENNLNGLCSRIEHARIALSKSGYKDVVEVGNPMWYLNMAIQDIELIKKMIKKEQENRTCKN